nr:MAG TPA: peptidase [Caudoviricetes sp.]
MIIANLTGQAVDIPAFAQYCIKSGSRVSGGTDMRRLANVICRDYGLTCETTNDSGKLLDHLAAGGIAVANVSGNRKGYTGVFSDSGHYVVVAAAEGDMLSVLDPAMYAGKFNMAGRKGKVAVEGNVCKCDVSVLAKDVYGRSPAYYLFSGEVEQMPDVRDLVVSVKGKPVTVKAINHEGSNYVLLRDVPKLVPVISVGYDAALGVPRIE